MSSSTPVTTDSTSSQDGQSSRLQEIITKYGKVGLAVWVVVAIVVLFGCYAAIELGVDTKTLLQNWGMPDNAVVESGGKFFAALALQKLLWPFRIALTAIITPVIVAFMPKQSASDTAAADAKKD